MKGYLLSLSVKSIALPSVISLQGIYYYYYHYYIIITIVETSQQY